MPGKVNPTASRNDRVNGVEAFTSDANGPGACVAARTRPGSRSGTRSASHVSVFFKYPPLGQRNMRRAGIETLNPHELFGAPLFPAYGADVVQKV